MLEKVADFARRAVKLAEPYKPNGGQFLEFCSISLSTYQTCMKLTRKSTEFCQFFCRQNPLDPIHNSFPQIRTSLIQASRSTGYLSDASSVTKIGISTKKAPKKLFIGIKHVYLCSVSMDVPGYGRARSRPARIRGVLLYSTGTLEPTDMPTTPAMN